MSDEDLQTTQMWLEIHLHSFEPARTALLANIDRAMKAAPFSNAAKELQEFADVIVDLANIAGWVQTAYGVKKLELYERAHQQIRRMKELSAIFEERDEARAALMKLARKKDLPKD